MFKAHGGDAPALEAAIGALRDLSAGAAASPALTKLFDELGLVEAVQLKVGISEHRSVDFAGHLAVMPEAIARLDGDALARLNEAGLLEAAVFAAASLGTMPNLVARKQRMLAAVG